MKYHLIWVVVMEISLLVYSLYFFLFSSKILGVFNIIILKKKNKNPQYYLNKEH